MASSAASQKVVKEFNAFTELMTPKPKSAPNPSRSTATSEIAEDIPANRRNALGIYIDNPTSFPSSVVICHNPDFVTIRDRYPKSSIHLLVLPRNPAKTLLHPFEALDGSDPAFLSSVRAECARVKSLAASELRRLFGKFSAQDQAREAALSADPPHRSKTKEDDGEDAADDDLNLPPGRDWSSSIMVGVHAVPSMSHLHIHVVSVDRRSDTLRHRKHYNSFSTPFFVPLEDLPLAEADVRRWSGREGYLKRDFRCWRCGKMFGNGFKRLKEHLEVEFEAWKSE